MIGTIDRFVFEINVLITMFDAVWGSFGSIYKCNVDFEEIVVWGININFDEFIYSSKILLKKVFIFLILLFIFEKNLQNDIKSWFDNLKI